MASTVIFLTTQALREIEYHYDCIRRAEKMGDLSKYAGHLEAIEKTFKENQNVIKSLKISFFDRHQYNKMMAKIERILQDARSIAEKLLCR